LKTDALLLALTALRLFESITILTCSKDDRNNAMSMYCFQNQRLRSSNCAVSSQVNCAVKRPFHRDLTILFISL